MHFAAVHMLNDQADILQVLCEQRPHRYSRPVFCSHTLDGMHIPPKDAMCLAHLAANTACPYKCMLLMQPCGYLALLLQQTAFATMICSYLSCATAK